ncbi:hypothetical protein C5C86_06920 [Rathayibacter sp. AY1E4]|jgi:hypothetical protein|uniref:esterase/lipase family protein n=1 Tax=unclassified Rathayibacter TaxID=2609250 RepID=UPI000CE77286|nr:MULTISPECIES: hypothetical protein [unclassified Rathayibacter]PPF17922.1 hypothetical protein C5B95_12855 [Rathayibacter sp. AY1A7]PPF45013.1 hypothetical protein C5E14_13185 [Rathayibacter sp. AY1A1]PPG98635.1 hypothetical protein C5C32_13465 [Rathayibacter sp. AY1G9]PPH15676.1 hypothetical protein C5C35_12445 [Rathayibacter sp. AY1F8]PPH41549.1 hypothetical protein C5C86_06920 [Rathayibacter sp. AY1E4]
MRLVIVVLAALLVVVGVVVVPAGRAEAAEAVAPSSCGVAELAPVLAGDDVRPRSAAALVPIVMLHGWLGTATHDADRTGAFSHLVDMVSSESATAPLDAPEPSLLGRLQQIDGAAVYTFDYRRLAARWVTDPGISDALASSIACLVSATGHRAVVVAHSMGGLAARQALSGSVDGTAVASMVSSVLTFGTPNTGSDVAERLGRMVDDSGQVSPAVIAGLDPQSRLSVSAMLASCGDAVSEDAEHAGECTGVPMIDALASAAGKGLRTGSTELGSLPPWPAGVHVTALVGDIQVTAAVALGLATAPVDLGDIMVATGSATAGVDDYVVSTCRYTYLAAADVPSLVAELSPFARLGDALRFAKLVVDVDASPCHHARLTRNVDLVEHATGVVSDVVAGELSAPHASRAQTAARALPAAEESRRRSS